jgi:hypothetical protein
VSSNLDVRIAIYASQGYTVHDLIVNPAKRGTALAAKLQAETMLADVGRQQVLAREPSEPVRIDLRV